MIKEGPFYLFTCDLPAVPFFVINLVMGLTPLRTGHFSGSASWECCRQLNLRKCRSELGKIQSIDDILSPQLIISFVLLGIFPLLVKKILTG
ncbi:MAG: hypothetical protein CM1200mP30_16990 [Pseudomonadota bacterium]|nr:MAG: hypothetical protein CM1200mP30_16990 [Pseudomonadota bacterium]